ncbi:NAD(P)-binding protein [Aspergillus ibericus CBS 121593]|uniref:NAD(P)-binding protein n=1 Tax=Aspergillus ibericus CBS 121593 TaxID=1448316 RepID=A0A395H6W3_9EURO|nr:NAD(P)-binding protein [Aspergillus ibericus CBS 121593]RAL03366.1 NAD(P)-binding protein [Aspergillus ibericus CBS 121593]
MTDFYFAAGAGATVALLMAILWIQIRDRKPNTSSLLANGKVVIVTGGLSGLGYQLVKLYRANGARVAVLDVKGESGLPQPSEPRTIRYYKCDVSNRTEVEVIMDVIETELGTPNILINCAAMPVNKLPFHCLQNDLFVKTISTNFLGSVNLIRAILPKLINDGKRGSIVNISSVVAHLYPAGLSDYTCSKAGLSALHHCLEAEARLLGYTRRIKFHLVEVGQMQTPLFNWVKPPNPLLAPVLQPSYVAQKIFNAVYSGEPSIIRLPRYVSWVCAYDGLPLRAQRLVRYLMGVDEVLGEHESKKTIN